MTGEGGAALMKLVSSSLTRDVLITMVVFLSKRAVKFFGAFGGKS